MNLLRAHGWRLALVASGAFILAGGALHPESDGSDPLREELATMTADEKWVPGHSLVVAGTVLLVVGLWAAYRRGAWGGAARRALKVGAIAFALYAVETVAHAAAAVDSEALAAGDPAPVAFTHIGLAAVLYPVSGFAMVYLADAVGRAAGGWRRWLAVPGVVGGVVHALSVPGTLLFEETELTPMFAAASILMAVWAVGVGVAGAPVRVAARTEEPVAVRG